MSDLKTAFEQAAAASKTLPAKPDNDTLLQMYSLYKQATVGDVQGDRPGMMDFVGRAKYDAWARIKGTTPESAMQSYVDLVTRLQAE
jgi:acyl-CoA-binding protein